MHPIEKKLAQGCRIAATARNALVATSQAINNQAAP